MFRGVIHGIVGRRVFRLPVVCWFNYLSYGDCMLSSKAGRTAFRAVTFGDVKFSPTKPEEVKVDKDHIDAKIDAAASKTSIELAGLRSEMGEMRGNLGEMQGELRAFRGEINAFRGEILAAFANIKVWFLLTSLTIGGAAFTVAKFV